MAGNRIPELDEIGNIFFQDGFKLAKEYLAGGVSDTKLIRLMSTAYEAVDGLIISFRNRCEREGLKIDCRKACAWCCHQAVLVSTQEVLLISRYLSEEMTDEQRQLAYRNAFEKEAVTGDMNVREFLQTLHPCPFLRDQSCMIYPVRPMACRCYLSADVETCMALYHQPGNRQIMAALYDFPLCAGRSINEGIRAVLMQNRIVTSEWLLEVLITKTFAREGIFDEWLSGEDPFTIRTLSADEHDYLREYRDRQESFKEGD
jgi:Fe-S-cluster containining protein